MSIKPTKHYQTLRTSAHSKFRIITFSLAVWLNIAPNVPAGTETEAARGVLQRLLPNHADQFILESINSEGGHDFFEIDSREGKIVLRGNNGVSICSALNWYLKYTCHADVTWSGIQLNLPDRLPSVQEKVVRVSPHKYRYFFNYCCFGYSLSWWDWEQWEWMIDWMALNGINMPLAVTGQEATWQAVLKELGLSQQDCDEFLAGPPYLPFGWMGCLDGWGAPISESWIARHAELQKRILERERTLGMTPVMQGFTGHVPPSIKKAFPDAELHKIQWIEWNTYFLDSQDPLFRRIGRLFLEKQTEMFGTNHLYAADTFIEMTPPSNDPGFLSELAKAISGTMTAADPEAVWVMQGWIFYNNAEFWKPPQAEAFLTGAEEGRMILLDLFCDQAPVWKITEAFYGRPWIWCVVQNFGNTIRLGGPLHTINEDIHAAMNDPQSGNLSGIGMIQEGLGYNPVFFDLMTEKAWHREPVDLPVWLQTYAHRRYGTQTEATQQAWQLLLDSVYTDSYRTNSTVVHRPVFRTDGPVWHPYDETKLKRAWELLLSCSDQLGEVDTYQFDLVNITRQVLSNWSSNVLGEVHSAYANNDIGGLRQSADEFLEVLQDLDTLLATREEFLLGRWLEDAKSWGQTKEERNIYEWNARNVITLWGDAESRLHDYARKEWSGLIAGFYLPRWEMFFNDLEISLNEKQAFDADAFEQKMQQWEEHWTHRTDSYSATSKGNIAELVSVLHEKYADKLKANITTNKTATASSVFGDYGPERAVDGVSYNRQSSWQAENYPQWLKIDLLRQYKIDRIRLHLYWDSERYYQYTIETSQDGNTWTMAADMRENKSPAQPGGTLHQFDPIDARFIRVNMLGNSANTGVHIIEVEAFEAQ